MQLTETGFITFIVFSIGLSDKIADLTDEKYLLVEADNVYIYKNSVYLYHIANLSAILTPYENIIRTQYSITQPPAENILINKIKKNVPLTSWVQF